MPSESAANEIDDVIAQCGFVELAISISHSLKTETLPLHHRDPFDRMLIAQAGRWQIAADCSRSLLRNPSLPP